MLDKKMLEEFTRCIPPNWRVRWNQVCQKCLYLWNEVERLTEQMSRCSCWAGWSGRDCGECPPCQARASREEGEQSYIVESEHLYPGMQEVRAMTANEYALWRSVAELLDRLGSDVANLCQALGSREKASAIVGNLEEIRRLLAIQRVDVEAAK